jgi:hypothetical protein
VFTRSNTTYCGLEYARLGTKAKLFRAKKTQPLASFSLATSVIPFTTSQQRTKFDFVKLKPFSHNLRDESQFNEWSDERAFVITKMETRKLLILKTINKIQFRTN